MAADVAGYVACWQPASVPPPVARFARSVVELAEPPTRARANALLWAASRVAAYAVPLGLEPVPEVLLHPSVIERFAASAPGLSGSARRTLRTNLRFLARQVVPALAPADAALPRERAKAPYSPAEIDGYLALADAQPTVPRRMRAAGLVCLGAGAGLTGADLRGVRGSDVACRSGGVVVDVHGARPRAVPVTPPEHPPDCCARQTLTVPPDVAAKTRQKHDYPSAAHRRSYARRTGAERTFSTAKDPASNNIARGWTRLMGLAPLMLWLACLMAVRNQRILIAWDARQDDNARRAAAGLPPRTRRRKTLTDLATAGTPP